MRPHHALLSIPLACLTLTGAAVAQDASPEPSAGPWALMLGVPNSPGGQYVYSWVGEVAIPAPVSGATGYVNRHWELSLPQPASVDPDPALWRLSYMEYDCDAARYRVLEERRFRDEAEIVRTGPEAPVEIMPGTLAAFTMNAVCRNGIADQAPRAADAAEARVKQAAFDQRMHQAR